MAEKYIMIIDDDSDFVEATKNLLESKGFTVNTASNSEEGLKIISKNTPDLLLLDVMMTKRDEGFEFSRKLSKDEKLSKVPIIMITGIRKEMNLPFGFEADKEWLPVKAVLEKPVKPEQLLGEIGKIIK
jgi:two-component system alkaline phosphatase synthesis response regulator PhoP